MLAIAAAASSAGISLRYETRNIIVGAARSPDARSARDTRPSPVPPRLQLGHDECGECGMT